MNQPLESLHVEDVSTKLDTAIAIACKVLLAITGIAIGCVIGVIVGLFTGLIEFAC